MLISGEPLRNALLLSPWGAAFYATQAHLNNATTDATRRATRNSVWARTINNTHDAVEAGIRLPMWRGTDAPFRNSALDALFEVTREA